ncbi:MAG: prolyl oligopeptidase family serine peptidase [Chitinophagaceae bacterium]
MRRLLLIIIAVVLFGRLNTNAQPFIYPLTPKIAVADTIFGRVIIDNYRWMEDMNSQQMKDWLKAQTDYTNSILDGISGRNILIEEFKELDKLATFNISSLVRKGNRYFYKKTLAGENVSKLYYRDTEKGNEILLLDPTTTDIQIGSSYSFLPSSDGQKVLFSFSEAGKEIYTNRILNVRTKSFFPESIYPGGIAGFSTAWAPDSEGFIYTAPDSATLKVHNINTAVAIFYHRIGTNQKHDRVVLSKQHHQEIKNDEIPLGTFSSDGKYLVVSLFPTRNKLYGLSSDVPTGRIQLQTLVKETDGIQNAVIHKKNIFILSEKNAPNGKVLIAPIENINSIDTKTIIPESEKIITSITAVKDYLFIEKSDGINTFLEQYNFNTGKVNQVPLPAIGTAWISTSDPRDNHVIISVTSWTQPSTRYNYSPATRKISISSLNVPVKYPGTDELKVKEVEVPGHDGTMIPLSLIYHKNIKMDGTNIVYMNGYGAYGTSSTPWFNYMNLALLNRRVILATTHPRGGGERGEKWHKAALKVNKPNSWKDFISSAEFLVKEGYTSPQYITGWGGSAGGILIGRAITDRPELFASSIHWVPVSNAVRHEKRSNGFVDAKEFGTINDSTEAMGLIEMDAYLNVKKDVKYSAVLAMAGFNDPRVPPWQPGKFIAALQDASKSDRPVLLLINYEGGHTVPDDKYSRFKNTANQFAFALWQTGHKDFNPGTINK